MARRSVASLCTGEREKAKRASDPHQVQLLSAGSRSF